jgi:hypothetical protein
MKEHWLFRLGILRRVRPGAIGAPPDGWTGRPGKDGYQRTNWEWTRPVAVLVIPAVLLLEGLVLLLVAGIVLLIKGLVT